jgi:LeuA allosteric (dimerisation) domain
MPHLSRKLEDSKDECCSREHLRYHEAVNPNQEHQGLITRVLGDAYVSLKLHKLIIEESNGGNDATSGSCKVTATITERDKQSDVEGAGVGAVDAMFTGLLSRYGAEYPSLRTLSLVGFSVSAAMETKKAQSGVDAMGTVVIDVQNSEARRFSFQESSRSVTLSSARCVLSIVEYFVNSERAFIMLDKARRDASERNREDLVSRYTAEMVEIVECTSYTEVIASIRKRMPSSGG